MPNCMLVKKIKVCDTCTDIKSSHIHMNDKVEMVTIENIHNGEVEVMFLNGVLMDMGGSISEESK